MRDSRGGGGGGGGGGGERGKKGEIRKSELTLPLISKIGKQESEWKKGFSP